MKLKGPTSIEQWWSKTNRTSNLKVGLGRKEEGRKERIERKKTGKKKEAQRNRKNQNFPILLYEDLNTGGSVSIRKL